ncbi:hypothetical protein CWO91_37420 [Bradyrhizobium genosp. SA-3]|nr:hypothetical protein CWO91_37420 [Bradyrhizobium genosp. SA-3]
MRAQLSQHRHCEEPLRRSNPESLRCDSLDCFAALAMTESAVIARLPLVSRTHCNAIARRRRA